MNTPGTIQVSILVAARNEEQHIARCLASLDALDFSKQSIEILIGDDDSEDATAAVVQHFIKDKSAFSYFKITERRDELKGKANVLAQLARHAKGKYFFFCDADIAVAPTWLNAMLPHFKPDTGVVVGVTRMKKAHLLADFLSLEWLFVLGLIRLAAFFRIPMTGLGNNMAVSREAYFAIGGYEKVGFSIVEDYAIFMAIVKKGFGFKMAYSQDLLSISEPVNSLHELLLQRRRWIKGVMESVWAIRASTVASSLLVPGLLVLAFWYPEFAFVSLGIHYLLVTGLSMACIFYLKQKDLKLPALIFWCYMLMITTAMLVLYLTPGKMIWKGRKYD